jgi:hypothetical protein
MADGVLVVSVDDPEVKDIVARFFKTLLSGTKLLTGNFLTNTFLLVDTFPDVPNMNWDARYRHVVQRREQPKNSLSYVAVGG